MPWIIDYELVLERLRDEGLRCNYYNGGAFGFPPEAGAMIRGWVGPPDETIKPGARVFTRPVPEPYADNLVDLAMRVWQEDLPGRVWLMPTSHWAYELTFGSKDWMIPLLENIDLDPGLLASRNNAAAIEFAPDESDQFRHVVLRLLEMLMGSDFLMAFPKRKTVCTIHHHKQLWWVSPNQTLIDKLDAMVPKG